MAPRECCGGLGGGAQAINHEVARAIRADAHYHAEVMRESQELHKRRMQPILAQLREFHTSVMGRHTYGQYTEENMRRTAEEAQEAQQESKAPGAGVRRARALPKARASSCGGATESAPLHSFLSARFASARSVQCCHELSVVSGGQQKRGLPSTTCPPFPIADEAVRGLRLAAGGVHRE